MNRFKLIKRINTIANIGTFILIVIGVGFKKFIPIGLHVEFGIVLLIFVSTGLITLLIQNKTKNSSR